MVVRGERGSPALPHSARGGAVQGVETGPVQLILHVRPCEGLIRQVDGTIEKRFGKQEVLVPIQVGCMMFFAGSIGVMWREE